MFQAINILLIVSEHPELMQEVNKTPPEQLENLKQLRLKVEVIPYAENVKIESDESREEARRLPSDRIAPRLFEMGIKDPDKVPVGKISLREAIDMVRGHRLDPETFNVKYLAEFHDMKEEDVFNILDFFKTFEVYNNDDQAVNRRAPWYSAKRMEEFLCDQAPLIQLAKAAEEEKKREAWKKYLEEKKAAPKPDPKLIEFAGREAIEAHRQAQQQQPEKLPQKEEPKRIP
jgi:NADH dehydrogenase [ubiquinone] 1 alpha subcomplex assembly factor 4